MDVSTCTANPAPSRPHRSLATARRRRPYCTRGRSLCPAVAACGSRNTAPAFWASLCKRSCPAHERGGHVRGDRRTASADGFSTTASRNRETDWPLSRRIARAVHIIAQQNAAPNPLTLLRPADPPDPFADLLHPAISGAYGGKETSRTSLLRSADEPSDREKSL